MNEENVKNLISRLESILSALKHQNSGADCHEVNSIRNTASMLIHQLEHDPDCLEDGLATQITKNTEEKLVKFYKKKYPSRKRELD